MVGPYSDSGGQVTPKFLEQVFSTVGTVAPWVKEYQGFSTSCSVMDRPHKNYLVQNASGGPEEKQCRRALVREGWSEVQE